MVERVTITELFGKYSYDSLSFANSREAGDKISVIVGDNGTGKTTILRLIYSCLSHEEGAGLRSFIGKTPFRRMVIALAGGIQVVVNKAKPIGSYTITITEAGKSEEFHLRTDADGDVPDQPAVDALSVRLRALNIDVLFVDHSRRVRSTYEFLADVSGASARKARSQTKGQTWLSMSEVYISGASLEQTLTFPLSKLVAAVHDWFRVRAFRQGNTGEQDASFVYLEVVRALSRRRKAAPLAAQTIEGLVTELSSLREATEPYIRHGLLSRYPFDELSSLIETATKSRIPQVYAVLAPFLTSIRRRMEALRATQTLISIFEEELNRYFRDKVARFHVLDGLSISDTSSGLSLDSLSSGERQLVFLLSASLLSRDGRSLILIDEPELSLNYRWQRIIASSLARLTRGSSTQFVLASHSIEIISRHVDTAIEL